MRNGRKPTTIRTPFMQACREILADHELSIGHKEALAYLIWQNPAASFAEKIQALEEVKDSIPCDSGLPTCAFARRKSLRSFLAAYCKCASLISEEPTQSNHGIDFRWKLDSWSADTQHATTANAQKFRPLSSPHYTCDLELCIADAQKHAAEAGSSGGPIVVIAQYWKRQEINIEFVFTAEGKLSNIRQGRSEVDSCALTCALLLIEKDEWEKQRRAKWEGGSYSPLNPFICLDKNLRLRSSCETYYKKYQGVIGAFEMADLSAIESDPALIRDLFSQLFSGSPE